MNQIEGDKLQIQSGQNESCLGLKQNRSSLFESSFEGKSDIRYRSKVDISMNEDDAKQQNNNKYDTNSIDCQKSQKRGLFQQIVFQAKLKMFSQRLLNQTKSRMYKNMSAEQYQQLGDQSSFINSNGQCGDQEAGKQKSSLSNVEGIKPYDQTKRCSFYNQIVYLFQMFSLWIERQRLFQLIQAHITKLSVFDPSSNPKLLWDFLIMTLSLIYTFIIPLHIAFGLSLSYFTTYSLTLSASALFLVDIVFSVNTGYFEKGQLQLKRKPAIRNYIKNNLAGDILGGVYFFIHTMISENSSKDWWKDGTSKAVLNRDYFLIFFLLRISTFSRTMKKLEDFSYITRHQRNMISLIKLIFTILLIAHLLACLWVRIGSLEEERANNSWMIKRGINKDEWYVQYIESYYFTTVTMVTVGYGDIIPVTQEEQCINVVIMIISCGVFAYSMNTIGCILNDFQSQELQVEQNMSIINAYMSKKNISKQTQHKIREYLDYYWREERDGNSIAEEKIIAQLSDILKETLILEGNKIVLKDSKVFRNNFSDLVMSKTIPLIKEQRCTPEQIIFEEGDRESHFIYFIQKGSVEFFIETESHTNKSTLTIIWRIPFYFCFVLGQKTLKVLKKGSSFGEFGFFSGNPRTLSVRSKEFTTLLVINRIDFLNLISTHESDYESFCSIKDHLLLYKNYFVLDIPCFSCQASTHMINQCPFLHDIPNKQKLITHFQRNVNQERAKQIRTNQRFNSLDNQVRYLNKALVFQSENIELITNWYTQQEVNIKEHEDDCEEENPNSEFFQCKRSQSLTISQINNKKQHQTNQHDVSPMSRQSYSQNFEDFEGAIQNQQNSEISQIPQMGASFNNPNIIYAQEHNQPIQIHEPNYESDQPDNQYLATNQRYFCHQQIIFSSWRDESIQIISQLFFQIIFQNICLHNNASLFIMMLDPRKFYFEIQI